MKGVLDVPRGVPLVVNAPLASEPRTLLEALSPVADQVVEARLCFLFDEDLAALAPFTSLRALCFAGSLLTPEATRHLPPLPHLRQIDAEKTGIDDNFVRRILEFCDPEVLNLAGTNVTAAALAALADKGAIRELHLNRTEVDHRAIASIRRLESLEHLALPGLRETRELLALVSLPNLQALRLEGPSVNAEFLANLQKFPALRSLRVDGWLDGKALAAMGPSTTLRSLLLTGEETVGPYDDDLRGLLSLPNLENLRVGATVGPTGVRHLADHPALRDLAIERLGDTSSFRILLNAPRLERLAIGDPLLGDEAIPTGPVENNLKRIDLLQSRLTPRGIRTLRDLLPGATVDHHAREAEPLRFGRLQQRTITDAGSEPWHPVVPNGRTRLPADVEFRYSASIADAAELRRLVEVPAFELVEIVYTGAHLAPDVAYVLPYFLRLRTLNVHYCRLPGEFWPALSRCPTLERLLLDFTTFGDLEIAALARVQPLRHLSARATRLTGDGLRRLLERTALETLDIEGCRIDTQLVRDIRTAHSRTRILDGDNKSPSG